MDTVNGKFPHAASFAAAAWGARSRDDVRRFGEASGCSTRECEQKIMIEEEEVERSGQSLLIKYKRNMDGQSRKMNILPHVLFPYLKLRLSPIENARQYDINGTLAKSNANGGKPACPGWPLASMGLSRISKNGG